MKEALERRAEDLFRDAWGEPGKSSAKEWRAKTGTSKAMVMRGPKRGLWRDYSSGESGDLLDLYAIVHLGLSGAQADFRRVLEGAATYCGLSADAPVDDAHVEERRRQREEEAVAAQMTEAEQRAELVAELVRRARPVEGSPAAVYLSGRGIATLPADALAFLGPLPRRPHLMHPGRQALVVWARNEAGRIMGGQRILVTSSGAKAPEEQRKPSFGYVSGFPARFPARFPETSAAALCIAEGPETALSIWLATGLETWAVFGAGAFAAAPIPLGRKIILCPDQDAPGSPAAKAFAGAVEIHAAKGCDLWIARAPEPEGSKADLNDTLLRAGVEAVRSAIAKAERVATGPEPVHPGPDTSIPREQQIGATHAAVRDWGRTSARMARAMAQVRRLEAERLDFAENRRKEASAIRREVQARDGLDRPPTAQWGKSWAGPKRLVSGAQGVGKTAALVGRDGQPGIFHDGVGFPTVLFSPDHTKSAEALADYCANTPTDRRSPRPLQLLGRGANNPKGDGKMCEIPEEVAAAARLGVNVRKSICTICPFAGSCAYLAHLEEIKDAATDPQGVVVFAVHDHAFLEMPVEISGARYVFDERPRDFGKREAVMPVEDFDRDLRDAIDRRGKSRDNVSGKIANILSYINPVRFAILRAMNHPKRQRDVIEGELRRVATKPESPAETMRDVANTLAEFEDNELSRAIEGEVQAFRVGGGMGRPLSSRLKEVINAGGVRYTRTLVAVFRAIARELEQDHGQTLRAIQRLTIAHKDSIVADYVARPTFPAHAPILHIDGTADADLARAWFGTDMEVCHYPVERLGEAVFVTGHSFSTTSLTGVHPFTGNPLNPERAEALRARVRLAVAREAPGSLVVMTKDTAEAVGEMPGYKTATFGALRGRNMAETSPAVLVVGRILPPLRELERMARAFAVALDRPFTPVTAEDEETAPRLPKRLEGLRLKGGAPAGVEVEFHPDPTAQAVLRQIRDAETTQAVDRVRAMFQPKRIVVMGSSVPAVGFDRVVEWSQFHRGASRLEQALVGRRVLPLSPAEAVRQGLWPNTKAVQRDQSYQGVRAQIERSLCQGQLVYRDSLYDMSLPNSPALVVSYERADEGGRGGCRTVFKALVLAGVDEARAVLEAQMGPVEAFRIEALDAVAEAHEDALQAERARRTAEMKRRSQVQAPPSGDLRPAVPTWLIGDDYEFDLPRAVGADTG